MPCREKLEAECRTYARYLLGQPPADYVQSKYLHYHLHASRTAVLPKDLFDEKIVALSARSAMWARIVDAYACRCYPASAVRNKLVLTLALLECAPPSFRALDAPERDGIPGAIAGLIWQAARFAACTVAGLVLLSPLRVLCAAATWRSAEKRRWKESL